MAIIEHLTTDMGNGCAMCSECAYVLSEDPLAKLPATCPKCGVRFGGERIYGYNYGGSDF